MINIIIGQKSNLSNQLKLMLDNVFLISTEDIEKTLSKIDFSKYQTINIIFNQFQTSKKLYKLDNPMEYIYRSIDTTSIVLEYIKRHKLKISKIIYTSSSSVYGNNMASNEFSPIYPLSLHSSLKISNEKLIELFCLENDIDYTITRVYNMYGGNDNFSVISKIINTKINNEILTLVNNGEAIRDFIHIDDVVYSYLKILNIKGIPIINIGTGDGKSVSNILDTLKENGIMIDTVNVIKNELKISICKNKKLKNILGDYVFRKVEDYILLKINNYKK